MPTEIQSNVESFAGPMRGCEKTSGKVTVKRTIGYCFQNESFKDQTSEMGNRNLGLGFFVGVGISLDWEGRLCISNLSNAAYEI